MKRIVRLTESEKNHILGMHKNAMINENKVFLNEVDLKQIQQLLIDKKIMSPTLTNGTTSVDGKLGPVTLNAIYSALNQTQNIVNNNGGTNSGVTGSNSTPFQNKYQIDYFRIWMYEVYPSYSKEIKLSLSGDFTDSAIQKAYQKYGNEFFNRVTRERLSTLTTPIPKCFYDFEVIDNSTSLIISGQIQVWPNDSDMWFMSDGTWEKPDTPIMKGKWWDDGKQASCDEKYCGKVDNITATNLVDLSKKMSETYKNVTGAR